MKGYLYGAVVLAFISGAYGLYYLGKVVERQEGIKQDVKALTTQEKLREKYRGISARDLCLELGGLPDDCELLVAD